MNTPTTIQTRIQQLMTASGMLYAIMQIAILIFAAIYLLPLLGPPDAPGSEAYLAYANHTELFRLGNWLMVLPPLFFYPFLGGLYGYFRRGSDSVGGILLTALLSGAVLIMIWPFGAALSLVGVEIANQGGDPLIANIFDSVVPASLALSTIPRSVFLCCVSVLLPEHKRLSRTGFVIATLSLAGSLLLAFGAAFLPLSLGSAVLFQAWVFCVSFKMFRSQEKQQVDAASVQVAVR